jgi:hypothetical protein
MKRYLVALMALLLVAVVAAPSFAGVDFKYGGMFRLRLQAHDNLADGTDDIDDNSFWIDQRLRMYFSFIASERLQVVTKWEADTMWGNETSGAGRHGGGDVGADATNLEMKNVYLDFLIPETPVRATLGVQGIAILNSWIADNDYSAAVFSTKMNGFNIRLGYIAARNEDVTSTQDDINDLFLGFDYAEGPLKASLFGFWQAAGDQPISTQFFPNPTASLYGDNTSGSTMVSTWKESGNGSAVQFTLDNTATGLVEDNNLFDLGLSLGYKMDWLNVFANYVQNLGSYKNIGVVGGPAGDVDYTGFMVEAGATFSFDPFTFTLGGFYTSGDDDLTDDKDEGFRYPSGASHYWSEIMGCGTLDASIGEASDRDHILAKHRGDYNAADGPSNLWMISAGGAWQALPTTKLTLNYYYIQTANDVIADLNTATKKIKGTDNEIGHEFDFYVDQQIVDGLAIRLVGAYLFAGDALTVYADDDNIWETGAQLLWSF